MHDSGRSRAETENLFLPVIHEKREFQQTAKNNELIHSYSTVPEKLLSIHQELANRLSELPFSAPIEYIYNPVDYAFDVHAQFVNKFCHSEKQILFLGMNPGPWGMSQTGVPFGEVTIVRDWLGISGEVRCPSKQCPKRPVLGFNCKRREISGWKFWNFFKGICLNPFRFFRHAFVYNYCPLAFMTATGKNVTPAEMKSSDRKMIDSLCERAFCKVLDLLHVDTIIAVGKYAEKSAASVTKANGLNHIKIVTILHPSPRNFNSKNWEEETKALLQKNDLMKFFCDT
ncbi:single-strand selective monofunctional uracil DNA glycosylase isoform X3 [Schistocerca nitens]|uniref:single-strand selective monofunctional uracil DNA glycosylase isoform X3 n=1 Tax=Schistocerca nitens TaxID=7011 RepID=UPI002117D0A1|nr:single-strand selective monofunctional uracil DNA glycosylase isoform X3 [Schistocerca nitens]